MELLKKLGLTGYESKVYFALLSNSILSAKELSEISGVPFTAVYPNLDTLLSKGFIRKYDGEVAKFEAIDPNIALESYVRTQKMQLESLKKDAMPILSHKKSSKVAVDRKEPFVPSGGMDNSLKLMDDLIKSTKRRLYIVGWNFSKSKYLIASIKKLAALKKKKVDLRILITNLDDSSREFLELCRANHISCRYHPMKNFSMICADGKRVEVTAREKEVDKRHNFLVADHDLGFALEDYFRTLWEKSMLLKRNS